MKVNHSLRRIFTSQTRAKLLVIFFSQPEELYYVRQLVRLTGEEINSVRRELENLKNENLLLSEVRGNRLYYWANLNHYLAYGIQTLANQHSGLAKKILLDKNKIGNIKFIAYSQDFLNHKSKGDIDMIVVGDVNSKLLDQLVNEEESLIDHEINYMVMDKTEFRNRKIRRDPILVDFFLNCPAIVIGSPLEAI